MAFGSLLLNTVKLRLSYDDNISKQIEIFIPIYNRAMLVIRNAQLKVFSNASWVNFRARLAAHLLAFYPQASTGGLDASVRQAQSFGLHSERDLFRWVSLCGQFGFHFLDEPGHEWMRLILQDSRITLPSSRLKRLVELCILRDCAARDNETLRKEFVHK
jgi:hypothetical protein